ncbi:MAG: dihydroneopterin aldolase [Bacteroidetes bacterium]|nr:dihydroneopterin aldolase [Bacteroidota bacterium]MBT6685025.1 dihydroneopterin aldolase [Bacteroidota bacterium]MBT7143103.1 dihydroneopterin aldolase [Bacteroidota bacterium]MBT7491484.1 dihydroneopterin aldolase [Bacteroidota bacterium]
MMGLIQLEGMEFYAYHGHYEEERNIGSRFLLDLYIETDTDVAAKSDSIDDALDYHKIYKLIQKEMEEKSHLLENIANRILDALYNNFDKIENAELKVSKIHPPIGGQVDAVSVTISR